MSSEVRREPYATPSPPPQLEDLQPFFEELGLNGYQARVMLALLKTGSATGIELAKLAGIPRTSVYPVLHELSALRLVSQVPGKSAVWVSPGVEEVLNRLQAEQQERFRALETKVVQARELLDRLAAKPDVASLPYVQVIHSGAQSKLLFEQHVAATHSELLMFTRPPSSRPETEPSEIVLGALARGVAMRVLYQASDILDPPDESWLSPLDVYHDAGVDGRVVDSLPMKLAIFDRKAVLLALSDPVLPEVGFPTSLVVEHPDFALFQVRAFEDLWSAARPFDSFRQKDGDEPETSAGARRAKFRRSRRVPPAAS